MKHPLVFLSVVSSFLLCYISTYSQKSDERILQLRIAPFNLFDPYTGVIQFGLQKRFSHRFGMTVDYGIGYNALSYSGDKRERLDYQYYKAKMQLKYYCNTNSPKPAKSNNAYLAIEGFYFPQHYRKEQGWLKKNNELFQYQQSKIDRLVSAGAFIIGDEKIYKHITLDYYIGVGLRWLHISHETEGEVIRGRSEPADIGRFYPIDEKQGIFTRPHVSLGFKVGYILLR